MAKLSARTELNSMIVDYSEKLDLHRTSFDEECRKIKYEAELASKIVNAGESSLRGLIREDTHIMKNKNKLQGEKSLKAYHSCLCDSTEKPLNRLTVAESKPFSDAVQVLNSDKDLVTDFLSEPNSLVQKWNTNLHSYEQSNKIVTLKALLQNGKSSSKFACHCSSQQPLDSRSLTNFSMRGMKRKLKHKFGSRRKETNSDKFHKFSTLGKLPYSRSVFGHDCIYGVEASSPMRPTTKAKEKMGSKLGHYVDIARRKIDVSSDRLCKKDGVDAALEATIDLSARVIAIGRFIYSHETDSFRSPRRESLYCSGSSLVSSNDEEAQNSITSPILNKFNGTNNRSNSESDHDTMISNAELAARNKLKDNYESLMQSIMLTTASSNSSLIRHNPLIQSICIIFPKEFSCVQDSSIENETFSDTPEDSPSSPASVNQLDMLDNAKNQEHRSPVSVLDQFNAEECSSPSNTSFLSAQNGLKPQRLHFEECSLASPSQTPQIKAGSFMGEQDYTISNYVRLIIRASSLDWDELSAIRPLSEQLLHPSSSDHAQFLMSDPHFNTRLLFDLVNEVLLKTQRSHLGSPYRPALAKPRTCCLPLEEAVVDVIMREAEFYLLPYTNKRTLDQLVAKDFPCSRLQIDTRPETEQIIVHISEDILEEYILDVILQLHL